MPRPRHPRGAQAGWPWTKARGTEQERFAKRPAVQRAKREVEDLEKKSNAVYHQIRNTESALSDGRLRLSARDRQKLESDLAKLQSYEQTLHAQLDAARSEYRLEKNITPQQAYDPTFKGEEFKKQLDAEAKEGDRQLYQRMQSEAGGAYIVNAPRQSSSMGGHAPYAIYDKNGNFIGDSDSPAETPVTSQVAVPSSFDTDSDQTTDDSQSDTPSESGGTTGSDTEDMPSMRGTASRGMKTFTKRAIRNPRTGRLMAVKRR